MSEIGKIGQMYEDRRTKKQGKLLERDEKYKTLLMESPDGKSFNISFGGFKSNWRSIEVADVTEENIEEVPVEEKNVPAAEVKKPEKKVVKKKKEREVNPALADTTKTVIEYINSFSSSKLSIRTVLERRSNAIRVDGRKFIEFIYNPRNSRYTVCSTEKLANDLGKKPYSTNIVFHEKWKTIQYSFFVGEENFTALLDDLRPIIVDILSNKVEKGE